MKKPPPFDKVAIVGMGLLGASLAAAIRRRRPDVQLTGVSSPATLARAEAAGLVNQSFAYVEMDAALADADLILLCTPIAHILELLEGWGRATPSLKRGALISDVGSTKGEICSRAQRAVENAGSGTGECVFHFIGSHPMTGSEKSGIEARDPHLFENASWVLCPLPSTPRSETDRFQAFVESLGARTTRMDAEFHDKIAAYVSHLPQLMSTGLAGFIGAQQEVVENCLQMAGGGFRDMTRLAASPFSVWEPILATNREAVAKALTGYLEHLGSLKNALPSGETGPFFGAGNTLRARLSTQRKGFSYPLCEIVVDLEDQPGMLVKALQPLAEKNLNVLDLEILKVREGEDGTLMMAFKTLAAATEAVACLEANGFGARLR